MVHPESDGEVNGIRRDFDRQEALTRGFEERFAVGRKPANGASGGVVLTQRCYSVFTEKISGTHESDNAPHPSSSIWRKVLSIFCQ
jgi:hypothetical protein